MKIKPAFFISVFLLFLIIFSSGRTSAEESNGLPKMIIEQSTVEFPPVIAGSEVAHVFKIHNKGDAILTIPGIYTEWGCTTASYSREIPPGGTGEITLKINTDGKAGEKITQNATVYTNDPEKPKIALTLTGEVIPAAGIEPQAARLMGKAGDTIQIEIKITPPPNNPFNITDVTAEDGKNIRFHLEQKKEKDFQFFILHISNTRPDPGRYFDKIILKTTSGISPELHIRVFGIIRDASEE